MVFTRIIALIERRTQKGNSSDMHKFAEWNIDQQHAHKNDMDGKNRIARRGHRMQRQPARDEVPGLHDVQTTHESHGVSGGKYQKQQNQREIVAEG